MSSVIKLVQNDTGPAITVTLTDDSGVAVNVSAAGDVVKFYFRAVGSATVKNTITCTKPNGGADGVVKISWPVGALDTVGAFEGEIEITFDTGVVQTMYEKLKFHVRAQVA